MAEAGEGRAPGSPVQPVLGFGRTAAIGGRRADLAEPLRPPGSVSPAETVRRVSLPAPGSRAGPFCYLRHSSLSSWAATFATARDASALRVGCVLPEPPGEHIRGAEAENDARLVPGTTAAAAVRPDQLGSLRGPSPAADGQHAAGLAHWERRSARHRPTDQQYRVPPAQSQRVRAASGDASQERGPHQLKRRDEASLGHANAVRACPPQPAR